MKTKQLQTGWREVELRDVFDLKYGSSLPESKRIRGNIEVYGSNGVVGFHNKGITKGQTIIVGRKGSIGKINLSNKTCFPIDTTYYIDETKISCDIKWLFYILKKLHLDKLNRAAAVPGLNRNDVYGIKILFPPLGNQKKIVSILEKAEQLKEKRKQTIEFLDDYLKSVFNKLFLREEFPNEELESVAEITMGQSPPGESYNNSKEGVPFFQGKAEFTERYAEVKKWTTKPSKLAEPESILISVRAPVGDVNICPTKSCIGRGLASIVTKPKLRSDYLYSFLKLNKEKIADLGSGSTFKAITSKQLSSLKIPIPPIRLQQKFVSIVGYVEKLKEKEKQSLEEIEKLSGALTQRAFRGELI